MPYTMQFDQKEVPPELLYKVEQAKNEERTLTESSDAANPAPNIPNPDYSPVKEVVVDIMSHWAADDVEVKNALVDVDRQQLKEKNQDLEDKASIKTGFTGDFVPDSAGPATDVGMPEKKPVGGKNLGGGDDGGGGDGGGGGPADDLGGIPGGGGGADAGGEDGGDENELSYGGEGDGSGDEDEPKDKPFPDDDDKKKNRRTGTRGGGGRGPGAK